MSAIDLAWLMDLSPLVLGSLVIVWLVLMLLLSRARTRRMRAEHARRLSEERRRRGA